MNFPSLKELGGKAKSAFARFPITLLWSLLGSFYCIIIVEKDIDILFDENNGILLTLLLGISWLIGTRFLIEQFKNPNKWLWVKVVTLALLVVFYFHLPDLDVHYGNDTFYIRFGLYFLAGHLFVLFAPFAFKWNAAAYWNYLKSMGIAIVRSGLFSGILFLGLVLALLAVDSLFEMEVDEERYFQLFIFCLGVVNTWIYLSDFPKDIHQETQVYFNKAIEVLIKYILLPLVILYLIILYAYGIKILFQWELPKGWVSYLVTALAFLGFTVEMLIHPVQKMVQSRTMNKYHPWFYILILPLIVLLFVAIYRRIADYGITENRYFVLALAFWILGITLYMLFSKKRYLKVIPLSLFAIAVLSSFGPWGAFSISKNSQLNQFKKVYAKVMANNKVATGKEYNQLESIIDYLGDLKAVNALDETVGISMNEAFLDTTKNKYNFYHYNMSEKTLDSVGITVAPEDKDEIFRADNYYRFGIDKSKPHSFDIKEYDYFTPIQLNDYNNNIAEIGEYKVVFSVKENELTLTEEDNSFVIKIPLKKRLTKLKSMGKRTYQVEESLLEVLTENKSISTKLFMREVSFRVKNDSIMDFYSDAYLFLKRK